MFGIHKKLHAWQQAGLISADQATAITTHEKSRNQGRFGRGMTGLALFAIIVGILSIVAANWAYIPPGVKLSAHLLLNAGLCVALWRAFIAGRDSVREGLVLVLAGVTLTLIALIGQVFQLGGSYGGALLLWLLAIAPMMLFFGQTRLSVIPGMLAFIGALPVIMIDYLGDFPDFWIGFYVLLIVVLVPLGMIADGHMRCLRKLRPVWAGTAQRFGFAILTLMASTWNICWYESRYTQFQTILAELNMTYMQGYMIYLAVFALAALALGVHWWLYVRTEPDRRFYTLTWGYAAISVAMMALPILLPAIESQILAAVLFIAYWGFIGWYAQQTGAMRLLSLSIFVIAMRIYIIYLEAFGGLMSGGFGLISGGVIMLAMLYGARKLNTRLTGKGGSNV